MIELVDTAENIDRVLPILDEMVSEGMVTLERVEVIAYRAPAEDRYGASPRLVDDHLGLGAVAEAARLDLLLLEILVDLEEVLDLVAELGRDVVDVADAHPGGVLERDAEDLLVRPLLVRHVEDADDASADPAARERRLADEARGRRADRRPRRASPRRSRSRPGSSST